MVVSDGHFGGLAYYDADLWVPRYSFKESEVDSSLYLDGVDLCQGLMAWGSNDVGIRVAPTTDFKVRQVCKLRGQLTGLNKLDAVGMERTGASPAVIAAGSTSSEKGVLVDLGTGRVLKKLSFQRATVAVKFLHGHNKILLTQDQAGHVQAWDLASGSISPIRTFLIESESIYNCRLAAPDNHNGLFATSNSKGISLFDFASGKDKPFWRITPNKYVYAHSFYGNVMVAHTDHDSGTSPAVASWDCSTAPPADGVPLSELARDGGIIPALGLAVDHSQIMWGVQAPSGINVAKFPK